MVSRRRTCPESVANKSSQLNFRGGRSQSRSLKTMDHFIRISKDRTKVDFVSVTSLGQGAHLVSRGNGSLDAEGNVEHIVRTAAAAEDGKSDFSAKEGWTPVPPTHPLAALGIKAIDVLMSNAVAGTSKGDTAPLNSGDSRIVAQKVSIGPKKDKIVFDLEVVDGEPNPEIVIIFRGKEYRAPLVTIPSTQDGAV